MFANDIEDLSAEVPGFQLHISEPGAEIGTLSRYEVQYAVLLLYHAGYFQEFGCRQHGALFPISTVYSVK